MPNLDELISDFICDVGELPDRSSPENWPEAMLVTGAELSLLLRDFATKVRAEKKLWLWKNYVDGRPEFWAFDNPFPCREPGGDPLVLGEPVGYALVKESVNGRPNMPEALVIERIKMARPA